MFNVLNVNFFAGFHGFLAATNGAFACNDGDRINFPEVITNVGGSYMPGTSEFICPVSGVYMFSATMMSQKDRYGVFNIKIGTDQKAAAWSDGRGNAFGNGNNIAIVECDGGQRVWVECGYNTSQFYGDETNYYNTFTGMLVQEYAS